MLVGSSRIDSLEANPRLVPAPAGLHETLARLPAAARGAGRTAFADHSHLALHVSLRKRFDAGNLLCKARSHLQQALSSFRAGLARLPKFGGPWSLLWSKQVKSWKACTSSVPHEHSMMPKPALASHRLSSTGQGAGAKLSNQCLLRLPLWLC